MGFTGARRLFDRGLCREAKSIYHVCNFYFRTKTHKPKVRGLGVSPQPCRACFTYVVGVHVDYLSYVAKISEASPFVTTIHCVTPSVHTPLVVTLWSKIHSQKVITITYYRMPKMPVCI